MLKNLKQGLKAVFAVSAKMSFYVHLLHEGQIYFKPHRFIVNTLHSKKSYRRIFISSVTGGHRHNRFVIYSDLKPLLH